MFQRLLLILLLVTPLTLFGQAKYQLGVSYYGASITRPGIALSHEFHYPLSKKHSVGIRTMLGYYHHKRLTNNFFILPEGVYQYTFPSGFFLNALAGGGYTYSRLAGDVYEYSNGAFTTAKNPGRGYFMPSAGLGFGIDWSARQKAAYKWFFNIRGNAKYPFNDVWLWYPSIETGVSYQF